MVGILNGNVDVKLDKKDEKIVYSFVVVSFLFILILISILIFLILLVVMCLLVFESKYIYIDF